jgi:hypothetical protein
MADVGPHIPVVDLCHPARHLDTCSQLRPRFWAATVAPVDKVSLSNLTYSVSCNVFLVFSGSLLYGGLLRGLNRGGRPVQTGDDYQE